MFRVGVCGAGVVGRAVALGFETIAYIWEYDKNTPVGSLEPLVKNSEFIFICVPTPPKGNGEIDLSEVDDILGRVAKLAGRKKKIVIMKSTVVPGTTVYYQRKYPYLKIVANPEFLTARTALLDFINSNRVIIGGEKKACERVAKLYRARMPVAPIFITTAETAELAKYVANCFFATKIGFFNEIYQLCRKLGVNFNDIKEMTLADGRIGNSHMDVPGHDGRLGWGGGCFPKDTRAMYFKAKQVGVDLKILGAAIDSNNQIRGQDSD